MKYLVTGHQVIPGSGHSDQVNYLRAGKAWAKRHMDDGSLVAAYSFADGGGMFIMNTTGHDDLMRMLLTFPLAPMTQFTVKPLLDFDQAADIIINTLESFA